jgi:hypothetical protein
MSTPDRLGELNINFTQFFGHDLSPYGSSTPVFSLELDEDSKIKLPTGDSLIDEVEGLRRRIIHPFRLRGTAGGFMEQAKGLGVFSAKKVENVYEADIGSIATYQILPADNRVASDRFLFMLEASATNALNYSFTHANWGFIDRAESFDDNLSSTRALLTMHSPHLPRLNPDSAVELAACYDRPYEARYETTNWHIRPDLEARRKLSWNQGGDLYERSHYEAMRLWEKRLDPFREARFNPYGSISEYSPLYVRIDKQEVLDIIDTLGQPKSIERLFVEAMARRTSSGIPSVRDSVLHLLGEQATLRLIDALHSWEHDNEPALQYAH